MSNHHQNDIFPDLKKNRIHPRSPQWRRAMDIIITAKNALKRTSMHESEQLTKSKSVCVALAKNFMEENLTTCY